MMNMLGCGLDRLTRRPRAIPFRSVFGVFLVLVVEALCASSCPMTTQILVLGRFAAGASSPDLIAVALVAGVFARTVAILGLKVTARTAP